MTSLAFCSMTGRESVLMVVAVPQMKALTTHHTLGIHPVLRFVYMGPQLGGIDDSGTDTHNFGVSPIYLQRLF